MNNLADRPLVEGSAGGRHGGGTRLTPRGIELVQSFRVLEVQHRRFLDSLNAANARTGDDLQVLRRLAMQTSARNQFSGKIARLTRGAANDEVEIVLRSEEHTSEIQSLMRILHAVLSSKKKN